MRCSGSPTTCIAAEPSLPRATSSPAKEAATQFEAMLFRIALEPLGKALGFFGDVAVDASALALARGEHRLSAAFERLVP